MENKMRKALLLLVILLTLSTYAYAIPSTNPADYIWYEDGNIDHNGGIIFEQDSVKIHGYSNDSADFDAVYIPYQGKQQQKVSINNGFACEPFFGGSFSPRLNNGNGFSLTDDFIINLEINTEKFDGTNPNAFKLWYPTIGNGGGIRFEINYVSGFILNCNFLSYAPPSVLGEVYDIKLIYHNSNSTQDMYINGTFIDTQDCSGAPIPDINNVDFTFCESGNNHGDVNTDANDTFAYIGKLRIANGSELPQAIVPPITRATIGMQSDFALNLGIRILVYIGIALLTIAFISNMKLKK